jgi:hypothetical protein
LQRFAELGEVPPYSDRQVALIDVAEMVAVGANQALLERAVANQSPHGCREALGEW